MAKKKKEMDNLAKDAAAALAAGMSYGKWKAMQGYRTVEKIEEIPEGWKLCKRCGKAFKPTNKQIYCDIDCQKAAQREKDKGKRREYWKEYAARKKVANESCTG